MPADPFERLIEKFLAASAGYEQRLRAVRPGQWSSPTPCTEWDVRALTNHMTRGNLNFAALANGGSAADFLRLRNVDALGSDPLAAFADAARQCADAFAGPGGLDRILDYPRGAISGRQVLAIRTADSVIHTWDLARAIGADEELDAGLVAWMDEGIEDIYAGLPEMPTSAVTTHSLFAAPTTPAPDASRQDRLLHLVGRTP